MPATVSISHIGNPEVGRTIVAAIEDFFKRYSGDWRVTAIGASDNDAWELRVVAPDGEKKWKHNLYGHDDAHNTDAIIDALMGITTGYPSKKYLRLGEPVAGAVIGPCVGHIRGSSQWVNNIQDATADYEPPAKSTQEQLKSQLGIETTLEEVPDAHLMISKWVVCKVD
jgi:hypothetical protein